MILVTDHIHPTPGSKKRILLRLDRRTLAKRRFRAAAEDGTDFGFDLAHPLSHGDAIHETNTAIFVIEQEPESVLRIAYPDPQTAATYGWMIGNMHFPAAFEEGAILAENDPAVRQLLERNHIHFHEATAIFQPPATAAAAHHH